MLKKVILAIKKLDENMRREEEELKVRLTKEGIETEEIRGKESGGDVYKRQISYIPQLMAD